MKKNHKKYLNSIVESFRLVEEVQKNQYNDALTRVEKFTKPYNALEKQLEEIPEDLEPSIKNSLENLKSKLIPFKTRLNTLKRMFKNRIPSEKEVDKKETDSEEQYAWPRSKLAKRDRIPTITDRPNSTKRPSDDASKFDVDVDSKFTDPTFVKQDEPKDAESPIIKPSGNFNRKKTKSSPSSVVKDLFKDKIEKLNQNIEKEKQVIKKLKTQKSKVSDSDKSEIDKEISGRIKSIKKDEERIELFLNKREQAASRLSESIRLYLKTRGNK